MINNLKEWLLRPFPFVDSYRQAVSISLVIGVIVTLFLYVFKPFGIDELEPQYSIFLVGYGLISFWSVYFAIRVMPLIFPKLYEESGWNILKNMINMTWILFIVSVFNWLYGNLIYKVVGGHGYEHSTGFLENVWMTVAVGVFPILISNYMMEKQLFARNRKLAYSLGSSFESVELSGSDTHISVEIPLDSGDSIIVSSDALICVKAEGGNYATAYWNENGEIKNQLWRTTLKSILELVEPDNNILQCHKSYLINRLHIKQVSGNARTLVFALQGIDFEVPVSRSFPREMVEKYHIQLN